MKNLRPSYAHLSSLAKEYDIILCDVWGVVHNGSALYPEAADALIRFRDGGGSVILVSNASRLGTMVAASLERLGMPLKAFDVLITSGDITRDYIAKRPDCAVFDIGPGDSVPILEGLDMRFSSLQQADLAVSSGAFDSADKKLKSLRPVLLDMMSKNLLLLCANPDVLTQLGERRVLCSGAVAQLYANLGGRVHYAGKPQAPIYERALSLAAQLRDEPIPRERVLVIGDSLRTDVAGAVRCGFASLFVWGGIHSTELGTHPSAVKLASLFAKVQLHPTAVTERLAW